MFKDLNEYRNRLDLAVASFLCLVISAWAQMERLFIMEGGFIALAGAIATHYYMINKMELFAWLSFLVFLFGVANVVLTL